MTSSLGSAEQNRSAAAIATSVAAVMIAQQVAGKAIRDAFFLSYMPAERLPPVMAASAVLSVLIVLGFTRLIVRHSPARIVPALFAIHGLVYVAEWALSFVAPEATAVAVYIHSTALGATVVSGFWSVINERFDPHTAKRFISRIAGGATAGGVVGGIVAWQAGQFLDITSLLILLTVANLVAAYATVSLARTPEGQEPRHVEIDGTVGGRAVMREVPYLRHVALLVLGATLVEAMVDYVFKAEVNAYFTDGRQLITFFSIFHASAALATFILQTTLAKRSLHQLGLTGTVATMPAANIIGCIVAVFVPGVWPVVGLRGGVMSLENSLYRSGYELLYTPLTPARKRPTKTLIDVGADRLGSLLGSGAAIAAIWLAPDYVRPVLLIAGVTIATFSLILTGYLHRGYVSALADSLRRGSVKLAPEFIEDATTRRTLADTAMALDRQKLLEEIAKLRSGEQGEQTSEVGAVTEEPVQGVEDVAVHEDEIAVALAGLRSGNAANIRQVFSEHGRRLPSELVPVTIQLLAHDRLQNEVITVLRRVAIEHVGQLCDAMLNQSTDFVIRRRIPRVLSRAPVQRCVEGLEHGLADERFEVRFRCGLALCRLFETSSSLEINREVILDAALREAERGEHVWRSQQIVDASIDDESEGHGPFTEGSEKVGKSLEHVFTILSLVLEREPLRLAFHALASEDQSLRGTGLEYLENVLPGNIREALWPYLGDRRVTKPIIRDRQEVTDKLMSSMSSLKLDIDKIRRASENKKD